MAATSNAVIAAIGAGGAVLGAIVGGVTTYKVERSREKTAAQIERSHDETQRDLEQKARDLEQKAKDRVMWGIARVWSKKLGDFYILVDDCSPHQKGSSWWKEENDVNPEINVKDMKRVAAAASAQQWTAIDYALTHVRVARAARDIARDKGIDDPPPISKKDDHTLRCAMKELEEAIKMLARLSHDSYPPDWLRDRIKKSNEQDGWRRAPE